MDLLSENDGASQIHCKSQARARQVLAALEQRMGEVGLRLHPDKTRIIYCKDAKLKF